jgi:hypothetical protein
VGRLLALWSPLWPGAEAQWEPEAAAERRPQAGTKREAEALIRALNLAAEGRRVHELRHTCAARLLAQGVPLRVVMEILDHSQISVTANTYSHVLSKLQRDAVNRMNDVFTVPVAVTAAVTKGHRGPADPPATR